MSIEAPTLDSFLRVHGLTLSSFDGKSLDEALRMTGLDDRALSGLGGAHRDRSLIVRGALIDRLAATQAAQEEPENPDEPPDESDIDDHEPPKKGKKKAKPAADDDSNNPPEETDITPDRHDPDAAYWRAVRREVALIVAAGAKARGEKPKPPSAEASIY